MKRSMEPVVVAIAVLAAILALGQEPRQQWKLSRTSSADKVHFTVEERRPGHHSSHSTDVPLANFRGLSLEQLDKGGSAKFEYVHDAGKLICEGSFSWARGSGSFTYVPNPEFASRLSQIGYEAPDSDQLFSMLMSDVSLEFARGVKDAGLNASTKELIDLRIHGVSLNYIQRVRRAGYNSLPARDYVEMRIHGVSTKFLEDLKSFRYDLPVRDVIELRIHGVSSEFVRDLKNAGYDLNAKQITELRIHGVSSQYLGELKTYGLRPQASDLVQLRIHGVSPEYLNGLTNAGYGGLSVHEITQLKIHGVDTGFIKAAKRLGYDFSQKDLVDLRTHGVSASYLERLQDAGMKNLSAAQITKLKIHGVD